MRRGPGRRRTGSVDGFGERAHQRSGLFFLGWQGASARELRTKAGLGGWHLPGLNRLRDSEFSTIWRTLPGSVISAKGLPAAASVLILFTPVNAIPIDGCTVAGGPSL